MGEGELKRNQERGWGPGDAAAQARQAWEQASEFVAEERHRELRIPMMATGPARPATGGTLCPGGRGWPALPAHDALPYPLYSPEQVRDLATEAVIPEVWRHIRGMYLT